MQLLQHNSVSRRGLFKAIGLALCVASAEAQSFNIDTGAVGTQPSATYGAGAGQVGFWNEVSASALGMPLVGLGGGASGVTIDVNGGTDFTFNHAGTSGDDQALMDSLFDNPSTITVNGLAPGNYMVYTYAWAPDGAGFITDVAVTGSMDPIQNCGGPWPGMQMLGTTYTLHNVVIGPGIPSIEIVLTVAATYRSCNGVQIVGPPTSVGTNYCGPAVTNSTGASGTISGTGTNSVLNNDLGLVADDLPNNAFGFFLTSRTQGLVNQPGGSVGVLCLGGSIGRYVGLGQIQNTGMTGSFSLLLDLTQTPTPTGLVSVAAGETWYFQGWHRDAVGGMAVSNFTDGLGVTFQ